MVVDSRILLAGLEQYCRALDKHLTNLQAEYQQLDNTWRGFSAVYQGDAADEFREGWMRTAQRFQEYIEQTLRISQILEARIEALRGVNRREGTIG